MNNSDKNRNDELHNLDKQIKIAELDKLIAEKNKIDSERKNYWVRNLLAFFSLSGILVFILTFGIIPAVRIEVNDEKIDYQEKELEYIVQMKKLDTAETKIIIREAYIKHLEDSLDFEIEKFESAIEYEKDLRNQKQRKDQLMNDLNESSKRPSSQENNNEVEQLTKKIEKINEDVKSTEMKKDSVLNQSFMTLCDSIREKITLKKEGKRYYLSLPKGHPILHERIGVRLPNNNSPIYLSKYNQINVYTTRYNYLKSISKDVDDSLKSNKKYIPFTEIQCEGKKYKVDLEK